MKSIAVTGTIGSGKSALSRILKDMGYPVFDCDQVCHSYLEKQGLLYHQVVELLSEDVLDENKNIDRKKVSALIFHDKELKKRYEQMFHEALKAQLKEKITESELFFAEVPLLFETGFDELFDECWLVICDQKIAIERCMKNRGMSEEDVLLRMSHQMSTEEKIKRADVIFINNTTLDELRCQVEEVLKGMKLYGTACKNSLSD